LVGFLGYNDKSQTTDKVIPLTAFLDTLVKGDATTGFSPLIDKQNVYSYSTTSTTSFTSLSVASFDTRISLDIPSPSDTSLIHQIEDTKWIEIQTIYKDKTTIVQNKDRFNTKLEEAQKQVKEISNQLDKTDKELKQLQNKLVSIDPQLKIDQLDKELPDLQNKINAQEAEKKNACFSFPTYKIDPNKIPTSNDFIREFREFMAEHPYGNDTDWLKFLGTEKQGNITAAECREIIQKLQLRSFESEYKILIMWYPEYLEKEGNILLKLIEEPTDKTLLFFVTSKMDDILPTIQSRTQLFQLKRLTDHEIKEALVHKGVSEIKAVQYARMAEGDFHHALTLMSDMEDDFFNTLRNWLNCLYANKGIELVEWVMTITTLNKEAQKKFLEYVIQLLEHLIRFKNIGSQNLVLLESEQKMMNDYVTFANLIDIIVKNLMLL
jgi:DNA polymerase-3 subunit delta'